MIEKSSAQQGRIHYIDGIRGFLAMVVILLHSFEVFGYGLDFLGINSDGRLESGLFTDVFTTIYHYILRIPFAVEAFIVISGYSLMIAVAKSHDKQIKGGLVGYVKRRIKRIWPPYYGALALTLLIIAFVPTMNEETNTYWDLALPAFEPHVIGSHLLFIHNWSDEWFHAINPPFWSIAVEEQIYVIFPLLLLPFWRRLGIVGQLMISVIVGMGAMFVIPNAGLAHSWFLVLFALGASAAAINFSNGRIEMWLREHLSSGILVSLTIICLAIAWAWPFVVGDFTPIRDVILGIGIAAILIRFTKLWQSQAAPTDRFYNFFSSPQMVRLGIFSYSLYLMHAPFLSLFGRVITALGLKSAAAYGLVFLVGIPLVVLGCYGFHLLFERPFMPPAALNWRREA